MPAEAPQELEPAEQTENTASEASAAADEPAAEEASPTATEESSEVVPAAGSDAPAKGRAGAFAARGSKTSPRRAPPATLEPAEDPPASRLAPAAQQRVEPGPYTVEPNDNFWTISEKVYGNGGYFKALREHNKQKVDDPDALAVGDVIEAPAAAELARRYPSLCPKPRRTAAIRRGVTQASNSRPAGAKTYTVAEGDTLFDIARYELGKAARWAEIYELNRDALGEDFDFLKPGTELVLPQQAADEELTRRRGEAVER
jgi:nucleoid-associated protein YgaU